MDKYIGVLGGLGHKATLLAYEKLNDHYQSHMGKEHTCPIRLLAIDFKEINELLPFKMDNAADKLLPFLRDIDRSDVICTIMINNTLHQAFDLLQDAYTLEKPIGHIGHLLTVYLEREKAKKVMILGSMYTMNSGYFDAFIPDAIEIVKPELSIQRDLEALRKTYYLQEDNELAKHCYNQLVTKHQDVDVFIVACTEHSMAFSQWIDSEKWVDTMDLQCNWAVDKLMKELIT